LTWAPSAIDALLDSGAADADAICAGRSFVAGSRLTAGAFIRGSTAIIDKSIAIVVFAIAADLLSGGQDFTLASAPSTIDTDLHTTFANADAVGSGLSVIAGAFEAIVDQAIAIVVFAIADLRTWRVNGIALQFAVVAARNSIATDPLFAGFTGLTAFGVAFIDLTVAVVVFTVAFFRAAGCCLFADELSIFALECTSVTDTRFAGIAGCSTTRIAFVDLAVAIVVFAVTDLSARLDISRTCAPFAFVARIRWSGVASACRSICTFWSWAAAVAAYRIIAGDPSFDIVVFDFVPSCIAADILACGRS
jgi:hypothetical protein